MENEDFEQQLKQLQRQYLCCFPIAQINWQNLLNEISWEQQARLIQCTYEHRLNEKFPIKYTYQLSFLKRLISLLEKNGIEVHDSVYWSYCEELKRVEMDKYAYKHYLLPNFNSSITLRESNSFVSEGTTGLCSWQASLALADYLLHNKDTVERKYILELGAGTGLCGIIVKRCLNPCEVLLTDGSIECVQLMRENIALNFSPSSGTSPPKSELLLWDDVQTFEWTHHERVNLLLAADVVYNEAHFSSLTGAIDFVFKNCDNQVEMLLAATVRNEQTLRRFTEQMIKLNFMIKECAVIPTEESYLHWDRVTPVKILAIKRGNCSKNDTSMHLCK